MSDVRTCPLCQAKAKVKVDKQSGDLLYTGLQDQDLLKKIGQLKKMLAKEQERNQELKARLAQQTVNQEG
ncbi:hypothetical protein [Dongshaea marina]|uniref:hypothetical protein n=1 Tax=Dongshaea marina TaxID=2047966 RepID=UPI000D3EB82C|nr:hypothetical protein [Dongshaea marina]